jgi:hypothetical protein
MPKEDVIISAGISALVDTLGPRKGGRFLQSMAVRMAEEERLAGAETHPASHHPSAADRRAAAAWFKQNLGGFLARLE